MDYIELTIDLNTPESGEILEAELAEVGFESFLPEGKMLRAYVSHDLWMESESQQILSRYPELILQWTVKTIPHTNWNAQWEASYQPVSIDRDIYIRAPFHPQVDGYEHTLIIEPNMSFGTGHHATTALMLRGMRSLSLHGKRVLDFGFGSGILFIYAGLRGATGLGIEIDAHAAEVARQNAGLNGISGFEIRTGDVNSISSESYDVVLANINRNVLDESLSNLRTALRNGGHLLCSGFLSSDADHLEGRLHSVGFTSVQRLQSSDWVMLHHQLS